MTRRALMKLGCLILFCLFASWMASAQVASNSAATSDAYSLAGTVQNSVTGEPIPHALVGIGGGLEQSVFTDSGGRFQFDHLRGGMTVLLQARKPGFLSESEVDPSALQRPVTIGPNTPSLTLPLIPEGVIYGHAQKPDAEAIAFLQVQVFYYHIADGRKRWDMMGSAQTNDEGDFRIPGLRPGRYYVAAGPRYQTTWIGAPGHRAQEAAYRPVFYPAVDDLPSSAPVDIAPGQQAEVDFTLAPDPVFHISGSVVGLPPDNPDMLYPRLNIVSRNNDLVAMPVGAESGNDFQAKVPAGSYILRAEADTPQGAFQGELPITVQSNISGLNVMVMPAPEIRVEVSTHRTRSAASSAHRDLVNIQLHGDEKKIPANDFGAGVVTSFHGVSPGSYWADMTPLNSDLYVESAQCGGVDLLRDKLVVGDGQLPPIQIVLRDDGGVLNGTVLGDGRGASGNVLLIPDRAPRQIKMLPSGPRGEFASPKLAPGDYTIMALDRITNLEYTNPDALAPYLSSATHASVAANGESQITVNLIRAGK